jgi:uncharacterized membrane protein YeaQ/YmgE (transglycosylase-associated protein family)
MTLLIWIILGLVASWLASRMMGSGKYGLLADGVVGVAGAVAGGWMGLLLLGIDATEPLAVAGAIVSLAAFRAISPARRRILTLFNVPDRQEAWRPDGGEGYRTKPVRRPSLQRQPPQDGRLGARRQAAKG